MAQILRIKMSRNPVYSNAPMEQSTFILTEVIGVCPTHAAFAGNKICPASHSFTLICTVKDILYFVFQ